MSGTKKILLDANIVINAAFLPQSFAAKAVALAHRNGSRFFVGDGVMRETRGRLAHYAPNEAVHSLAVAQIDKFLHWAAAELVTSDDTSPVPDAIPRSDRHVYQASVRAGAAVLTADAGLWLACRDCEVTALLPLELIRRSDGIALQTTIFGVPPTQAAGSIFARVYPGAWAGTVSSGKFTVAHFPGGFWLYYDAAKAAWVAEVAGLKCLVLHVPVFGSGLQTVCLSWSCDGDKPQIQLQVAGIEHPKTFDLVGPLAFRPSGLPTIGCTGERQHYWNGSIYYCVTNDKRVAKKSWRKYQQHSDLAPNPYDADRVVAAVQHLNM
jgi:hypothetical protein